MPVDRPIFVVAPHRCGTTLIYKCIARHPDIGWFNRADKKFPEHPRLARWMTQLRIARDTPRESHDLWTRFLPRRKTEVAGAEDATPEAARWFEQRIGAVLRLRGATRFASKYPSHSAQIPYLTALFPDALFVHMVRDWRAVVASTMVKRQRDFPGKWFGVRMPGWHRASKLPPHLGAAWHYLVVQEEIARQRVLQPGRFLQVRYEELTARPVETMRTVWAFCGLEQSAAVEARLPSDIRPPHDRWRETLTPALLAEIEAVHGDALRPWEAPETSAAKR